MIKKRAQINSNSTQVNFNASREIMYWARKYNTSQAEIQQMFAENGYSIARTLQRLQAKKIAA